MFFSTYKEFTHLKQIFSIRYGAYSNSIQQLLLVIRNGRQEVHARTLTSVCKSGMEFTAISKVELILKGAPT